MDVFSLITLDGKLFIMLLLVVVAIGVEFLYRHMYQKTRDEQHAFEKRIKKFSPEVEYFESKYHARETMLGVARLGAFILLIIIALQALNVQTFNLVAVALGTLIIALARICAFILFILLYHSQFSCWEKYTFSIVLCARYTHHW